MSCRLPSTAGPTRSHSRFMVIATQNPVEHHGAYPLPESQLDRFLMRLRIGYPDTASERKIVRQKAAPSALSVDPVLPVIAGADLAGLQDTVARVAVDESIVDYMLAIVERTRAHESLAMGVSPRGSQNALPRDAGTGGGGRPRLRHSRRRQTAGSSGIRAPRRGVNSRLILAQRPVEAAERVLTEILTMVDVPL